MGILGRWWGPVFEAERAVRSRRWRGYAARSLFVLGLLAGLMLVWVNRSTAVDRGSLRWRAEVGGLFFYALTLIELIAVLTVAPAATAGAICLDRSRGTLAHVFVTDLTDREVVLGKLAARLLPVWGLLACALPVAAAATWLGGIDPVDLTLATLIAASLAFLGCALALLLSVWVRRPHEALSVVYLAWAAWLLPWPVAANILRWGRPGANWLKVTQPFYLAHAPVNHPGEIGVAEPLLFCLACGLLGAACVAVAVARVRAVAGRSAPARVARAGSIGRLMARLDRPFGLPTWGPALDRNPVFWREWHRNRPSGWSRAVWGVYGMVGTVAAVALVAGAASGAIAGQGAAVVGAVLGLLATMGLLLVGVATASALAEERARGSLDVLIATPLTTRSIVAGKWLGAFRRVPWLAAWTVAVGWGLGVALRLDPIQLGIFGLTAALLVAQGAAVVGLALALATRVRRVGTATAATVAVLVALTVGGPLLAWLAPPSKWLGWGRSSSTEVWDIGAGMGSPPIGVAFPLVVALNTSVPTVATDRLRVLALLAGWTLAHGLAAWGLFEWTARNFDRHLGRMPEGPGRASPGRKPSEAGVGELLEGEVDRLAVPG